MIIHPGCVVDGRRIELFVGEETIQCFDDQKRLGMRENERAFLIQVPKAREIYNTLVYYL